jgi:folate-binding protein YgfZ
MKQRVLLIGKDAIDLLHRISTVNAHALILGETTPGLFLNPQGKILNSFSLILRDANSLEVIFDDQFLEILDRYTFAEKYEIQKLEARPADEIPESERIRKLIPKLGHEFKASGDINPLEINLRSAIHDNKGCYPGQEVIEKIISLGSPARRLCLLRGSTHEVLPAPLFDETGLIEIGTLTSASDGVALAIIKRTHLVKDRAVKTKEASFKIEQISS